MSALFDRTIEQAFGLAKSIDSAGPGLKDLALSILISGYSNAQCISQANKVQGANAVVASICANEGPYIHEFIHHYLYFGFSDIFIFINRTNDNTLKILEKIKIKHPNIHIIQSDWICWLAGNGPMQRSAYAFARAQILSSMSANYILYVDIDEFWYPTGFTESIGEYLQRKPEFDTMSFQWQNIVTREAMFQPPFQNKGVSPHVLLKSIVKASSPVSVPRVHIPTLTKNDATQLSASGICIKNSLDPLIDYQGLRSDAMLENHSSSDSFVYHRFQRSEVEYVARCLIQDSNLSKSRYLKTNREGYQDSKPTYIISIPENNLADYHRSLQSFINETHIDALLNEERSKYSIERVHQEVRRILPKLNKKELELAKVVFANTSLASLFN